MGSCSFRSRGDRAVCLFDTLDAFHEIGRPESGTVSAADDPLWPDQFDAGVEETLMIGNFRFHDEGGCQEFGNEGGFPGDDWGERRFWTGLRGEKDARIRETIIIRILIVGKWLFIIYT